MSALKKPKQEIDEYDNNKVVDKEQQQEPSLHEQEEALIALINHRSNEVEHLRRRISYYTTQLQEAEKRLSDTKMQLARLLERSKAGPSNTYSENRNKSVKLEDESNSPQSSSPVDEAPPRSQFYSKTELVIPSMNPKVPQPTKPAATTSKSSSNTYSNSGGKVKFESPAITKTSSDVEIIEIQDRGKKRKLEQKEQKDLVSLVRSNSSPCTIHCYTHNHIPSQHKRKMRSLLLCPVNEQLFATSALDGMVNLWQLQSRGPSASLLSSTDCASSKHRHWPEDIAWHPLGNILFSTYTADGGGPQISFLDLNKTQGSSRVTFLEDKPHIKGIVNSIEFMPWDNSCFGTGGSDHAVVLWNEKDSKNSWKPKALHRNLHSSAVMGIAGLQQKKLVLSAGADKRIVGFDVQAGRADFKYQLDSKCMSVLPNPCDANLFMVQTGTPEKQVRLFDVRLRQTEIHTMGFKQESSDSQSALINQAWSPDGFYITSGSVDPIIHIFDVRYNSHKPSQSIRAHQRRVFKAVWHHSIPLLISISSDLHIGLHKIT